MKEKIILTDCDGVLLDWNSPFEKFMASKGYPVVDEQREHYSLAKRHGLSKSMAMELVVEFNSSDAIRQLLPFRDSVQYVNLLHDMGFKFIAVTSVGNSQTICDNRMFNLCELFGDNIGELYCLPAGHGKYSALERWQDSEYFWIEDKFSNALDGHAVGLNSILIDHEYNVDFQTKRFPRVSNDTPWKDIYDIILDDYGR